MFLIPPRMYMISAESTLCEIPLSIWVHSLSVLSKTSGAEILLLDNGERELTRTKRSGEWTLNQSEPLDYSCYTQPQHAAGPVSYIHIGWLKRARCPCSSSHFPAACPTPEVKNGMEHWSIYGLSDISAHGSVLLVHTHRHNKECWLLHEWISGVPNLAGTGSWCPQ